MTFHPYNQSQFDAEYYGGGARGGFKQYRWEDPAQQEQLSWKFDHCHWHSNFHSVLFVGCALGFEVAYFNARAKAAQGVDISEYAINNLIPEARLHCHLYNGWDLSRFGENAFDLVASFDVLTLVPDEMIAKLVPEMVRVASKKIVVRSILKNWRNYNDPWDGEDGVTFRYKPFIAWDQAFTQSGKFRFEEMHTYKSYEAVMVWVKI